jgi:hypothetical protein
MASFGVEASMRDVHATPWVPEKTAESEALARAAKWRDRWDIARAIGVILLACATVVLAIGVLGSACYGCVYGVASAARDGWDSP